MFTIGIASGKGGTGKTTLAVNLYRILSDRLKNKVKLVDCDVEEPNDKIFFQEAVESRKEDVFKQVPFISKDACSYCRKCVEYCEFNAIVVLPSAGFAEVNSDLCHSCGACQLACEENAIQLLDVPIGTITNYNLECGGGLSEGRLKIGSSMQTMLIRELKKSIEPNDGLILLDSPPGTSCPVVETISDLDFVILVAEPTPFGLHDLSLMIDLLSTVKRPHGLVINKAGVGSDEIYSFLHNNNVPILGEIQFSTPLAEAYSTGNFFTKLPDAITLEFNNIAVKLLSKSEE